MPREKKGAVSQVWAALFLVVCERKWGLTGAVFCGRML